MKPVQQNKQTRETTLNLINQCALTCKRCLCTSCSGRSGLAVGWSLPPRVEVSGLDRREKWCGSLSAGGFPGLCEGPWFVAPAPRPDLAHAWSWRSRGSECFWPSWRSLVYSGSHQSPTKTGWCRQSSVFLNFHPKSPLVSYSETKIVWIKPRRHFTVFTVVYQN